MENAIDICEVAARALREAGIDAQARPLSAVDGKDGVTATGSPSQDRGYGTRVTHPGLR